MKTVLKLISTRWYNFKLQNRTRNNCWVTSVNSDRSPTLFSSSINSFKTSSSDTSNCDDGPGSLDMAEKWRNHLASGRDNRKGAGSSPINGLNLFILAYLIADRAKRQDLPMIVDWQVRLWTTSWVGLGWDDFLKSGISELTDSVCLCVHLSVFTCVCACVCLRVCVVCVVPTWPRGHRFQIKFGTNFRFLLFDIAFERFKFVSMLQITRDV